MMEEREPLHLPSVSSSDLGKSLSTVLAGTAVEPEPEPKPIQAVPPGGRANIRGVPGGRIDALRRLLEA